MKRKTTLAGMATIFAIASTAAFAQDAGPDFSPMKPKNFDEQQARPTYDVAPPAADNRMLDAYESSNTRPGEPAAPPVADDDARLYPEAVSPPSRGFIHEPTPRQSTIGNGLFDRRGPNDFGA